TSSTSLPTLPATRTARLADAPAIRPNCVAADAICATNVSVSAMSLLLRNRLREAALAENRLGTRTIGHRDPGCRALFQNRIARAADGVAVEDDLLPSEDVGGRVVVQRLASAARRRGAPRLVAAFALRRARNVGAVGDDV